MYYIDIIFFIISIKIFNRRFDDLELGFTTVFFYILLLEFQGFISITRLYYNKDFSAVLNFVLIRIELLVVICFVFLSRNFYKPIFCTIFSNILLISFLSFYWMDIYSLILRSYAHRLGSDVGIKNIYICRTLYNTMKNQSFTLFIFLLFLHLYTKKLENYRLAYILMTIPVFFIKVLEREEEENEDSMAKFINLFLLLCLSCTFIVFTILYSKKQHESYIEMLFIINSYHFLLSFLLGLMDYFNFEGGLKEALLRNQYGKEGRKMS